MQTPAQAASYSFSSVQVVGLQHIEQGTVLSYAGIARGKPMTDADLNDAYQRINNSGLFQSVELRPEGSKLVITVKEFPIINVINFEGNKRLKSEDLAKFIKSQSRKVYSPAQAEADAATITEAYRANKRYAVIVTPKIIPRSDNRVDLAFVIQEGKPVYVDRLSFVGNRAFSDGRLRQVLSTKQAGFLRSLITNDSYSPDRIDQDKQLLSDFYQSRGYIDFRVLDAQSQIDRERNGFYLTFSVSEGQPYTIANSYATTDLKDVDLKALQSQIRIRPGTTYSPTIIDTTVTRMENMAARLGYNFVRVTPKIIRDDKNLALAVNFVVDRGPKIFVERIDIEGNSTTQDRVIRRQFHTSEGDPFNPREIKAASERIKALGFFKDVQVTTKDGSAPDKAVVDVNVTEQSTGSLSFGGSYGVGSGFGLVIGFSESNFLGRGQLLSLNLNTTKDDSNSSFTFVEPALLGRDLKFSLTGNATITSHNYANYDTHTVGLTPSIEFPVSPMGRLELRYKLSRASVKNVDTGLTSVPPTTGASAIIKREQGGRTTSAFGYTYNLYTNRDGLSPDTNYSLQFGQDLAGFGGQDKYVASTALASAQTKVLKEQVTLRAELEGGLLNMLGGEKSTVTDRYFLNGKMIGFQTNGIGPRDRTAGVSDALGGTKYVVARLEAQFPVGLPEEYGVKGGVFANAGSVWGLDDRAGTAGTVDDSFHLRATAGFSVFWKTPIGPLRFDFSHAFVKQSYDRTQNFNFSISTSF